MPIQQQFYHKAIKKTHMQGVLSQHKKYLLFSSQNQIYILSQVPMTVQMLNMVLLDNLIE